jgi:hypothetical protein
VPSDLRQHSWRCLHCGRSYFLRRCSACHLVSHVNGWQGWHQPWPCTWCGHPNTGFTQNRDPAAATTADLAADIKTHQLTLTPAAPPAPSVPATAMPDAAMLDAAGSGTRRSGRLIAAIAVPACAIVVAAALLTHPGVLPRSAAVSSSIPSTPAHAVSIVTGSVATVVFHGVPGQLAITGTGSGQVKLSGELTWTGHAPAVTTRFNHATHELDLFYQCAPGSPCTENYQLAVPGSTTVIVNQPSARVVIADLAGPLSITGSSVDISATGLRSPTMAAGIVSGHLDASFAAPPGSVAVMLQSAQATMRLPASTAYQVTQQVASGYLYVGLPQAGHSPHTVSVQISSGELALLPS